MLSANPWNHGTCFRSGVPHGFIGWRIHGLGWKLSFQSLAAWNMSVALVFPHDEAHLEHPQLPAIAGIAYKKSAAMMIAAPVFFMIWSPFILLIIPKYVQYSKRPSLQFVA
jgi:hypothetical protein